MEENIKLGREGDVPLCSPYLLSTLEVCCTGLVGGWGCGCGITSHGNRSIEELWYARDPKVRNQV